jgi:hypothetical protein
VPGKWLDFRGLTHNPHSLFCNVSCGTRRDEECRRTRDTARPWASVREVRCHQKSLASFAFDCIRLIRLVEILRRPQPLVLLHRTAPGDLPVASAFESRGLRLEKDLEPKLEPFFGSMCRSPRELGLDAFNVEPQLAPFCDQGLCRTSTRGGCA